MEQKIVLWMQRTGFWRAWIVTTLLLEVASLLVTVTFMGILLHEVNTMGVVISLVIPLLFSITVHRSYMRMVLQLADMRSQLETLSNTDPLTGAPNRREFMRRFQAAFERSSRSGKPFAFLIFDLDDFKEVNDRFGHEAGDQALIALARVLADFVQPGEAFARYGGDEFMLILENCSPPEAAERAAALEARISALSLTFDGQGYHPHASLGWVCWSKEMSSWEMIFHNADQNLYQAKMRRARFFPPPNNATIPASVEESAPENG